MPSERSLFRKIQTIVEIAKSAEYTSLAGLCEHVNELRPTIFITGRYDTAQDAFISDVSEVAIRRAVAFCRTLQLLNDDGALTTQGRDACRRSRFSLVMADQVRLSLSGHGVKVAALNGIIRKMLHADPVVLPTSDVLWEEIQPEIGRGLFSKMLTLLVHSECGECSQKKVYLGFKVA